MNAVFPHAIFAAVGRAYNWWRSGMRATVPDPFHRWLPGSVPLYSLILTRHNKYELTRPEDQLEKIAADSLRGLLQTYEDGAPHRRDVAICIDSSQVLETRVSVPREAARDLRDLLAFEIERRTPFKREQVYYAWKLDPSAPAARHIEIDVFCIKRSTVDGIVNSVKELSNLTPVMVSLRTLAGAEATLLQHGELVSHAGGKLKFALVALTGLMIVVSIYAPLLPTQQNLTAMEQHAESLRKEIEFDKSVVAEERKLWTAIEFLNASENKYISRARIIAELTRIMPSDAWLSELKIRGNRIELYGQARNANALITLLSESRLFLEPRFSAPLTSGGQARFEQFSIQANIIAAK